jgi:Flp pilus assembly pilin Flp
MVEYGLIIALIAVALIATLQTTKGKIAEVFGRVDAGLDSAKPQ